MMYNDLYINTVIFDHKSDKSAKTIPNNIAQLCFKNFSEVFIMLAKLIKLYNGGSYIYDIFLYNSPF